MARKNNVRVVAYLDKDLVRDLKELAESLGMSLSGVIYVLLSLGKSTADQIDEMQTELVRQAVMGQGSRQ